MTSSRQSPADELSAWVAAAARHTLESGSARVWECRFSESAAPPERDFALVAEGVADLTKQRVAMRSKIEGWGYLAEVIAEHFPWLEDDDGVSGDGDESEMVRVHAGTAAFFSLGDRWRVIGERPGDPFAGRRAPGDPLWILEGLTLVDALTLESQEQEQELVRGERCRRLQFDVDLRVVDTRLEGRQVAGMSQRVAGDVWIDGEDRVRRVTWRRPFMRRPRSPLKLPAFTSWRTVELWDFGAHADIEIPTPSPPEPNPSLRDVVAGLRVLRRRKREYERHRSA